MQQFLKVVAGAYSRRYADISRLVFVMPNKRSGTFLLKAFSEEVARPSVAPVILPVNEFVATVADSVVDSRIDQVFRLYRCFLEISGSEVPLSFDKFSSWGDTMLNDFNEIDMQMASADEIFSNVYDYNRIKSNFLAPHHKKVLVQYFGYSPEILEKQGEEKFEELWQHLRELTEGGKESKVRGRFKALWELLGPLYEKFTGDLKREGLTTQGGAYREAAEKLEGGFQPFPGHKLVFVGFNALSESERRIFRCLKDSEVDAGCGAESKADFVWDRVSQLLAREDDPAGKFVSDNASRNNFPMPDWLESILNKNVPSKAPDIQVIAVPSNVMQAKVAGMELKKLVRTKEEKKVVEARVAVVLPDENLLIPLLYSLPKEFAKPNLTMGFPLKQTPVISFIALLRKLQKGSVWSGKDHLFFFEDVKDFLGHPYSGLLFNRDSVVKFEKNYEKRRRIMVSSTVLSSLGKEAEAVFRCFGTETSPRDVIEYIEAILGSIKSRMAGDCDDTFISSKIEKTFIDTYSDALKRLSNCVDDYDFPLSPMDVFTLADRLIAGETVAFKGEPLEGLQVMGVLETRCLDFDRVIMLSVNEKVMPRVGRSSSFIPNIVRVVFGLPPANYQEEIFAYYFFRLIGRSRDCVLTYDSRSAENRTPGASRYLLQMKYLPEGVTLREYEAQFGLPATQTGEISIEKTADVNVELERYTRQFHIKGFQKKNFSASALKHYFSCPVMFLYNDVLGLYQDQDVIESINAADMGTIVHRTIERLYFPEDRQGRMLESPILMTAEALEGLLKAAPDQETAVKKAARQTILEVHFKDDPDVLKSGQLRGSPQILLDYVEKYVRFIIEADIRQAPFRLWGSEIVRTLDYDMPGGGPTVRFKMVIDRLDQAGAEGDNRPFRIVDYKTGDVKLEAENLEDVFGKNNKAGNIFQLLFYAELFILSVKKGEIKLPPGVDIEKLEKNLEMVIYDVVNLQKEEGIKYPKIGKIEVPGKKAELRSVSKMGVLREIEEEEGTTFMQLLAERLRVILDRETPFRGEPSDENCRFCNFRLRCEMHRASLS